MIKIIKKALSMVVLLTSHLGWGMDSSSLDVSSQEETSSSSYSSESSDFVIRINEPEIELPVATKETRSQPETFWPVGKGAINGLILITPLRD